MPESVEIPAPTPWSGPLSQLKEGAMPVPARLSVATNYGPHPVLTYLARGAPLTRRTRGYRVQQLAAWLSNGVADALSFAWHETQYEQFIALRLGLSQRYAPGTTNGYIAVLKGVLKECWRLNLIEGEVYRRLCDVPGVTDEAPPPGRDVQADELKTLLRHLDHEGTLVAVRDSAMFVTLYGTGMRCRELCQLSLGDYDPHEVSFLVQGKGSRARQSFAPSWVKGPLSEWLRIRSSPPGALFTSMPYGRMDPTYRHLHPDSLYHIVRKRVAQAGLPHTTTHDFRRTNIGNLFEAGVDVATIGQNVGQKRPETTASYDRRGKQKRKAKVELLPSPF